MTGRQAMKSFAIFTAVVVGVAGAAFILTRMAPAEYSPARLDAARRELSAKGFYSQLLEFHNLAQENQAFEWSISASQLNEYLASMDQIAMLLPRGRSGEVDAAFRRAGLTEPAASLDHGHLTLMARSVVAKGVVSVAVSFGYTDQGLLRVRFGKLRLGRLPLPASIAHKQMYRIHQMFSQRGEYERDSSQGRNGFGDLALGAINVIEQAVLSAVDGVPVEPVIRIDGRRLRLSKIRVSPKAVTISAVPERR